MASQQSASSSQNTQNTLDDHLEPLFEYQQPIIDDHGLSRGMNQVVVSSEESGGLDQSHRRKLLHGASSSRNPVPVDSDDESLDIPKSQDSLNPCVSGLNQNVCDGDDIDTVHLDGDDAVHDVVAPVVSRIKLVDSNLSVSEIKRLISIPDDINIQFLDNLGLGSCHRLPPGVAHHSFIISLGQLQAGLILPLPEFFIDFCNFYNLSPGQLNGSVCTILRGIQRINTVFPGLICLDHIRDQYHLKVNGKGRYVSSDPELRTFSLQRRTGALGFLPKTVESDSDWPKTPILVSGNIYGTKDSSVPPLSLKNYDPIAPAGICVYFCFMFSALLIVIIIVCYFFCRRYQR